MTLHDDFRFPLAARASGSGVRRAAVLARIASPRRLRAPAINPAAAVVERLGTMHRG